MNNNEQVPHRYRRCEMDVEMSDSHNNSHVDDIIPNEHQHQHKQSRFNTRSKTAVAVAVVDNLSKDYRLIAELMKQIDVEVESFTGTMKQINESASNIIELTKLWENQTKSIHQDIREFHNEINSNKPKSIRQTK
jgi:hypothetical protein